MQGFNDIIQALGKFAPLISTGVGLTGLVSQMSLASKEKAALDRSVYYAKHPEAISAIAKKLQQPLSTGLTQGVENIVNASLGEQGLSQAPGIQSQVLAQALAPYQQNEQQMALTAALQAIGLPSEALKNLGGVANPTQLASLLKLILPSGSGSGSAPPSGVLDYPYESQDVSPLTPPVDPFNLPAGSFGTPPTFPTDTTMPTLAG